MAGASRSDSGNAAAAELWPREEARRLQERVAGYEPARPVIFESGFGPSGLPHLGTMAEILRPSFVRKAFHLVEPSRPSRLIVFIDDLDGLRMPGPAGADLRVGRIDGRAPRIARRGADDARHLVEIGLHAPEAAARESRNRGALRLVPLPRGGREKREQEQGTERDRAADDC